MKRILLFTVLIVNGFCFGQQQGSKEEIKEGFVIENSELAVTAVFPGCEKYVGSNKALTSCMQSELSNRLNDKLVYFAEIMEKFKVAQASASIKFVVNREGKIVDISSENKSNSYMDKKLTREAIWVLEKISKTMVKKGEIIQPAKLKDGTPVGLLFMLPIKFKVDLTPSIE